MSSLIIYIKAYSKQSSDYFGNNAGQQCHKVLRGNCLVGFLFFYSLFVKTSSIDRILGFIFYPS